MQSYELQSQGRVYLGKGYLPRELENKTKNTYKQHILLNKDHLYLLREPPQNQKPTQGRQLKPQKPKTYLGTTTTTAKITKTQLQRFGQKRQIAKSNFYQELLRRNSTKNTIIEHPDFHDYYRFAYLYIFLCFPYLSVVFCSAPQYSPVFPSIYTPVNSKSPPQKQPPEATQGITELLQNYCLF